MTRDVLDLEVLFATSTLTAFRLGGSYLLVEQDDPREGIERPAHDFVCLRMNVPDVAAVAKFRDPDGNLCAFKDDEKFEQQVEGS